MFAAANKYSVDTYLLLPLQASIIKTGWGEEQNEARYVKEQEKKENEKERMWQDGKILSCAKTQNISK